MDKTGNPKIALELCLPCMTRIEEAGWELEPVSSGMIVCAECGSRCWGYAYRLHRDKEEKA